MNIAIGIGTLILATLLSFGAFRMAQISHEMGMNRWEWSLVGFFSLCPLSLYGLGIYILIAG